MESSEHFFNTQNHSVNGFVHIGRFIKYMYSRTCPVIFWVKLAWCVERFIEKAEVNSQDNKQLGLTDKLSDKNHEHGKLWAEKFKGFPYLTFSCHLLAHHWSTIRYWKILVTSHNHTSFCPLRNTSGRAMQQYLATATSTTGYVPE